MPGKPSIYELTPVETGGPVARQGFTFQDHVAAGLVIAMLQDDSIFEVWCERLDDLTLLRTKDGALSVCFVQVKDDQGQLWSVPKLTARKRKGTTAVPGTSVLERSLAHDRCREPVSFLMVTSAQVNNELKPLTYPLNAPARESAGAMGSLGSKLNERVEGFFSENDNDAGFWAENCEWWERNQRHAYADNLLHLGDYLQINGYPLMSDQVQELYLRIVDYVRDRAEDDPGLKASAHIIERANFVEWVNGLASQLANPTAGLGTQMAEKMKAASIPPEDIGTAQDELKYYLERRRNPAFYTDLSPETVDIQIVTALQELRSSRRRGAAVSGDEFYDQCRKKISTLGEGQQKATGEPPSYHLGAMHAVTGRCNHRYIKP